MNTKPRRGQHCMFHPSFPFPRHLSSRRRASSANLLKPQARVELGVIRLDLPARIRAVQVARVDDVDAPDCSAAAQRRSPAERNGLAGNGVDGQDVEANGGQGFLALLEGEFGGEGDGAEGASGEPVDRVGPVGEVVGEEGFGGIIVKGGQERGEAVDEVGCGGVGEAGHGSVRGFGAGGRGAGGRGVRPRRGRGRGGGSVRVRAT